VLDAAGQCCTRCGAYANEVDHIRPIHRGVDWWDRANLQMLCRGCHIDKSASEARKPDPARDAWRALVNEIA